MVLVQSKNFQVRLKSGRFLEGSVLFLVWRFRPWVPGNDRLLFVEIRVGETRG